jgi:hypothetical protein
MFNTATGATQIGFLQISCACALTTCMCIKHTSSHGLSLFVLQRVHEEYTLPEYGLRPKYGLRHSYTLEHGSPMIELSVGVGKLPPCY